MRRIALGICLVLALLPASARAGASIVEPIQPDTREKVRGIELGPWIAIASPTALAGDWYDTGFRAGVTATLRQTRTVGSGLDLGYIGHSSAREGAQLDDLFSALSQTPIHGTKVALTGLEAIVHVRVVPLPDRSIVPWVQVGAGACRVNRRVELPADQLRLAGWQVMNANSSAITFEPVAASTLGLEFGDWAGPRLVLEVSHEWLFISEESHPFTSLSFGAHLALRHW